MRKMALSRWVLSVLLSATMLSVHAQGDGPPVIDPPPPSDCYPDDPDPDPNDECIPIDGGLAFLLLAGVGYGVLKNRNSQNHGS